MLRPCWLVGSYCYWKEPITGVHERWRWELVHVETRGSTCFGRWGQLVIGLRTSGYRRRSKSWIIGPVEWRCDCSRKSPVYWRRSGCWKSKCLSCLWCFQEDSSKRGARWEWSLEFVKWHPPSWSSPRTSYSTASSTLGRPWIAPLWRTGSARWLCRQPIAVVSPNPRGPCFRQHD